MSNLDQLKEIFPEFTEKVEKAEKPKWLKSLSSKNGILQVGNKIFSMYDTDDPTKDINTASKSIQLPRASGTILIGSATGKLLQKLLKKKAKRHVIILIEPDLYLLRKTLESLKDFKDYFLNTLYISDCDKDSLGATIGSLDTAFSIQNWQIIKENYTQFLPETYNEISLHAINTINQCRCNTGTVEAQGKTIAINDIKSVPYILGSRGVKELENIYKAKPCVVVSTGPSLAKNIHLLIDKEQRDKVVIVAVGQALRVLLGYGIKPDFICSVDFGEVNYSHYKGLMHSDVPFIVLNRSYYPILRDYQGPKFIVAPDVPKIEDHETICSMLEDKGVLEQGGSVAHLAFNVARYLGCSPIMLIGQDLAISDTSHIKQVDTGGKIEIVNGEILWTVTDPKSKLHGQVFSHGYAKQVPGYLGGMVNTNYGLASFILAFENLFKRAGVPVINCTEGGVKIEGCRQMSLQKALKKFAREEVTKITFDDSYDEWKKDQDIRKAIKLLKGDIKELKEIINITEKALTTVEKLKGYKRVAKPFIEEINALLALNLEYSKEAHKLSTRNPLMVLAIYKQAREIQNEKFNIADKRYSDLTVKKNYKIKIERNELIITSANKNAKDFLKLHKETLEQVLDLDNYAGAVKEDPPDLKNAQKFLDAGNFANPLLDCERLAERAGGPTWEETEIGSVAFKMRDEAIEEAKDNYYPADKTIIYYKLIARAIKIGKIGKFKTAEFYLKTATNLFPGKAEGLWGLATAYMQNKKYDESIKIYTRLMGLFPENCRFQFELGQVLALDDQIEDGIKLITNAMSKTKEFDSFFMALGDMYFGLGKTKEAQKCWNTYVEIFPAGKDILKKKLHLEES